MFKHVGKAIKGIAKALFILGIVVGVIVGIIVMVAMIAAGSSIRNGGGMIVGGIFSFLGIVIFSFIYSYLAVIILYAYGSITDDIKTIKETLQGMNPSAAAPTYKSAPQPVKPQPAPQPTPQPVQQPVPGVAPVNGFKPTGWRCVKCGHTNAFDNAFCEECGTRKSV